MRLAKEQIEARIIALWEAYGHLDVTELDTPAENQQAKKVMALLYREIQRWEKRLRQVIDQ